MNTNETTKSWQCFWTKVSHRVLLSCNLGLGEIAIFLPLVKFVNRPQLSRQVGIVFGALGFTCKSPLLPYLQHPKISNWWFQNVVPRIWSHLRYMLLVCSIGKRPKGISNSWLMISTDKLTQQDEKWKWVSFAMLLQCWDWGWPLAGIKNCWQCSRLRINLWTSTITWIVVNWILSIKNLPTFTTTDPNGCD